ncbi:MAG: type II toxin-antitoxin system RelE/ParE family toxin [Chryseolinea sp.]
MARQVIWSRRAQKDKKEILLHYWRQRNKSNTYSKKLNELFKESIKIIAEFPQIGKVTDDTYAKIKVVKDYLVIYEESDTHIHILTISNSRQDPDKLKRVLS